jgi:hypothetical protein
MTNRNLARVATDNIPGRRRYRSQQKCYANVEVERPGKDKRVQQQARRE